MVQRFEKSDDGNSAAQSENEFDELENAVSVTIFEYYLTDC